VKNVKKKCTNCGELSDTKYVHECKEKCTYERICRKCFPRVYQISLNVIQKGTFNFRHRDIFDCVITCFYCWLPKSLENLNEGMWQDKPVRNYIHDNSDYLAQYAVFHARNKLPPTTRSYDLHREIKQMYDSCYVNKYNHGAGIRKIREERNKVIEFRKRVIELEKTVKELYMMIKHGPGSLTYEEAKERFEEEAQIQEKDKPK